MQVGTVRWVLLSAVVGLCAMAGPGDGARADAGSEAIEIGSRLELLVDDYLIARMTGCRQVLHHPTPREVAIVHDESWEGNVCAYYNVFQDGDLYRMYYHAEQLTVREGKLVQPHELVLCYAESPDGIHWKKPHLGLFAFGGSKKNNIVLDTDAFREIGADLSAVAVFKDTNPTCPSEARYKAFVRSRSREGLQSKNGLLPFGSEDGIHWSPLAKRPVITKGAFDSQNLAFWDSVRGEYRAYFRDFRQRRRDIKTTTSKDFLNWTEPQWLKYPGAAKEQIYTNQIKPYYRAPHIFIGFPIRYIDRGWSESMKALPELEHRQLRASAIRRIGTALTEGLLMTSRDGNTFHRWPEAFLRPGPEREGSWAYHDHDIAWQLVETRSDLHAAANELSIYASESYWTGTSSRLRRYTVRIDGFVSINAPMAGGELLTKPLIFEGGRLVINFATSAAGSIRVEIQQADGKPIQGFSLADCPEMFGDAIERTVIWNGGSDVSSPAGKPVRLRFVLKDADLYSLRFRE